MKCAQSLKMRSREENRIYQRGWRKRNREKLNKYKRNGRANGGETIPVRPPTACELIERVIPKRPLLRVAAGIERTSKKARRELASGRRLILKRFESGVVDGI